MYSAALFVDEGKKVIMNPDIFVDVLSGWPQTATPTPSAPMHHDLFV